MLNENEMKEGNTMEEKEKNEQEETKEEEVKSEDKPEVEETKELEKKEVKEPSLETKYKDLEEKFNKLFKEKIEKEREIRHLESYKKYNLSQENINLLKRYLGKKDNIDEELSLLNKDFPHLFKNNNKDTNISSSLNIKDKFKEDKKEDEIDTRKIGMVG